MAFVDDHAFYIHGFLVDFHPGFVVHFFVSDLDGWSKRFHQVTHAFALSDSSCVDVFKEGIIWTVVCGLVSCLTK
jgi:hypothetical protein